KFHFIEFPGDQRLSLGQGTVVLWVGPSPGDQVVGGLGSALVVPGQGDQIDRKVGGRLAAGQFDPDSGGPRDVQRLGQWGTDIEQTVIGDLCLGQTGGVEG